MTAAPADRMPLMAGASLLRMQEPTGWLAAARRMRTAAGAATAAVLLSTAYPAAAADPVRGATLYSNPARPGMLPCADCHAENPIVNNFGNIWSGRNAVALIERAVQSNTGGMGVFQGIYGQAELADIAAYLGNAPNALAFAPIVTGSTSATRTVTVSSSLKTSIEGLTLATEGDFVIAGTSCGGSVPRFSSCTVDVASRPAAAGLRSGALVINHLGTPTPIRLPMSAEGLPPPAVARVFPLRVDFGVAGVQRHVELANDSSTPLRLQSPATAPAEFAIAGGTCVPGLQLTTGQRCTIALRAPPRTGREQRGTLTLVHDGIGGSTTVELLASGDANSSRSLYAEPASLDFGTHATGAITPAQPVIVVNGGTAPVSLREASTTESTFALDGSTCSAGLVLAPQQRCQLLVSFRPSREGPVTAELRLATIDANAQLRVGLAGGAGAATPQVIPARVALQAAAGSTARTSLTLVNRSPSPWRITTLSLSGPEAADFAFADDDDCRIGGAVSAGAHCTLHLAFTPRATGTRLARLRVEVDGGSTEAELVGQGTAAPAAALWLDTSAIDFGSLPIGAAGTTRSIAVHNRGDADLRWSQVAVVGDGARHVTLAGDCAKGALLPRGKSCRVDLQFTPTSAGEHTASLVLWSEAGAAPAVVGIGGRGVSATSASLIVDRLTMDFGRWPLLAPAAVQRLRLRNAGGAPSPSLTFNVVNAAFVVARADPACTAGLPPGASCTVDVAFRPAEAGVYKATLQIEGVGVPMIAVALSAEAMQAAPLLAWQSAMSLPSHSAAPVGEPATGPAWTLANLGNAASAPLRWVIDGPAAGEFSFAAGHTCAPGLALAPGATCTAQLSFHPQAAGARAARLVLVSEPGLDPVALEGRGSAAAFGDLRSMPAAVAFQARTNAVAGPQRVRLRNDGAAGLQITTLGSEGAAFSYAASPADSCAGELRVLMPGEECEISVAWDGSAAGVLGGRLLAGTASGALGTTTQLLVREDSAQRTNIGGGGGALGWPWLLALAGMVAIRRAARSE